MVGLLGAIRARVHADHQHAAVERVPRLFVITRVQQGLSQAQIQIRKLGGIGTVVAFDAVDRVQIIVRGIGRRDIARLRHLRQRGVGKK